MIPTALRNAWANSRKPHLEPEDTVPEATIDSHDPVVRYALAVISIIMLMTALSIAKAIAIPVTAGIIFGLVFGPPVDRLVRWGMSQHLAAGILVAGSFLACAVILGALASPFAIWSDSLPGVVAALKQRAAEFLVLARQMDAMTSGLSAPGAAVPTVAVNQGSPWFAIAETSSTFAAGLLIFIATIYFYLVTRRPLRASALRLCLGGNARRAAVEFLSAIETSIAGYFGTITVINIGLGVATGIIAAIAGLPLAIFWGIAAFVLNYIPFIGPLIVTVLLLGAGLVDESSIWVASAPAIAFFIVNLIEANVVTPLMVGRRLTVNPFLVFISFVFWLWLWGPLGAMLSTPVLVVSVLSMEAWRQYRVNEAADSRTAAVAAADIAKPPDTAAHNLASRDSEQAHAVNTMHDERPVTGIIRAGSVRSTSAIGPLEQR